MVNILNVQRKSNSATIITTNESSEGRSKVSCIQTTGKRKPATELIIPAKLPKTKVNLNGNTIEAKLLLQNEKQLKIIAELRAKNEELIKTSKTLITTKSLSQPESKMIELAVAATTIDMMREQRERDDMLQAAARKEREALRIEAREERQAQMNMSREEREAQYSAAREEREAQQTAARQDREAQQSAAREEREAARKEREAARDDLRDLRDMIKEDRKERWQKKEWKIVAYALTIEMLI